MREVLRRRRARLAIATVPLIVIGLAGAVLALRPGPSGAVQGVGVRPPAATATPVAEVAGGPCRPGAGNPYAVLAFTGLPQYGYAGRVADGDWSRLDDNDMVHYHGTPAPGARGNVIIGFHREPYFRHIDELAVGDAITITDASCHVFTYTVTGRWVLDPSRVTQLRPTTGHDLTLVTCTPWWVDSQRIIIRASLVPAGGAPTG